MSYLPFKHWRHSWFRFELKQFVQVTVQVFQVLFSVRPFMCELKEDIDTYSPVEQDWTQESPVDERIYPEFQMSQVPRPDHDAHFAGHNEQAPEVSTKYPLFQLVQEVLEALAQFLQLLAAHPKDTHWQPWSTYPSEQVVHHELFWFQNFQFVSNHVVPQDPFKSWENEHKVQVVLLDHLVQLLKVEDHADETWNPVVFKAIIEAFASLADWSLARLTHPTLFKHLAQSGPHLYHFLLKVSAKYLDWSGSVSGIMTRPQLSTHSLLSTTTYSPSSQL